LSTVNIYRGYTVHPTASVHPCVQIGRNCKIGANVVIEPWGNAAIIELGEGTIIHDNVRIKVETLLTGRGCKIHNGVTMLAGTIFLGDNVWIGQRSHLDGTCNLEIGSHVTIGFNCHLWTHSNRGGLPEGCNLITCKETVLGDYVWLMGCNVVVNPGVWMNEKSVALANSVVTHDTEPNRVYAGIPARKIREGAWRS
jgi:acetyltransferase-like isoleucine patch superfamily enzyme